MSDLLNRIDLRFDFVTEKLANHTIAPSGCWEYQGQLRKGYGRVAIHLPGGNRRNYSLHRIAYAYHNGVDPAHLCVCHHCDNPACINPDHLFLADHVGNMADMKKKGRANAGVPSKLTENMVMQVVDEIRRGKGNKEIAATMPVTHGQVSLIRLGKSWTPLLNRIGYDPRPYRKFTRAPV